MTGTTIANSSPLGILIDALRFLWALLLDRLIPDAALRLP